MYTNFFRLSRLPFEASPDPGFLFDGPAHREAIASIEYAVATRMGFIMLTGEVGLGKTTVIRAFLNRYDRGRLLPIYVFHPLVTFDELLELISDELGLTLDAAIGSFNRLRAIQRELIRLYGEDRQVVLVIDEAQRLPEDTLENLRLLTNLETDDAKLLQIVLVGQPELEAILAQPQLRQLEQRIMLKARLESLTREDSIRYLRHRLTLAGADDPEDVLSVGALDTIVELADGVPRRMNILANRTLIDAFGGDEKPVTAARVRRVAHAGLQRLPAPAPAKPRQRFWQVGGVVLLLLIAVGIGLAQPAGVGSDGLTKLRALLPASETSSPAATLATPERAPAPTPPISPAPVPEIAATGTATPPPAQAPASTTVLQPAAQPPSAVEPDAAASLALPPSRMASASPAASTDTEADMQPLKPPSPVPGKAPPVAPDTAGAQETLYTVMPGDTLWKICIKAYGPDTAPSMISKVMSRNKIVSDIRLLWGKTIILPPPRLT